ncbi:GIY-YIG nuclease family protein [Priestia sp. P5]|uniref:GIY-YIG nuclease family protein n=1 Tax=Priestia sp. P5 TaxID=2917806 RepID=UPI0024070B28|nr:GIY-YIG nuclease family protein [Priestia sp. P5]MDG0062109.1 GIY-YIG nuclease family protein [Priestia sp. P5]
MENIFGSNLRFDAIEYLNKKHYIKGYCKGFNLNKIDENLNGIYILYAKEEDGSEYVLYVGESIKMKGRLTTHLRNYEGLISKVWALTFSKKTTKTERTYMEKFIINLLQPRLNTTNTKKDFFESQIVLEYTGIDEDNYEEYSLKELESK